MLGINIQALESLGYGTGSNDKEKLDVDAWLLQLGSMLLYTKSHLSVIDSINLSLIQQTQI
jgi:hypothetical protein